MYNMKKSISGVRRWAGMALDALESQDIYDLFRNKKKGKKATLKSLTLKAIVKNKMLSNYEQLRIQATYLIMGAIPRPKYNSHKNSNLYLAHCRSHFSIGLLTDLARNFEPFWVSVAGVI